MKKSPGRKNRREIQRAKKKKTAQAQSGLMDRIEEIGEKRGSGNFLFRLWLRVKRAKEGLNKK